jgi:hypothetical protein
MWHIRYPNILQGTFPILQAQKERDEHSFTIILKYVLGGPLKRHINESVVVISVLQLL